MYCVICNYCVMFFVAGWDGGLKFILLGLSARKSSVLEKICAGTIGKLPVANLARPPDPLADPFPVPRASPVCVRLGPWSPSPYPSRLLSYGLLRHRYSS